MGKIIVFPVERELNKAGYSYIRDPHTNLIKLQIICSNIIPFTFRK